MPFLPTNNNESVKPYLIVETEDLKLIQEYSGINFIDLYQLDYMTFKLLFKDAFIYKLKQTEKGQEYLEDCYLIQQTNPDRESLRSHFGGDK